ncbi:MAG: glycosyltransferase [Solirubrobacteraceae bacterium]
MIGALDPEFGGPTAAAVSACIASPRCDVSNTMVYATAVSAQAAVRQAEDKLRSEGVNIRRFRTLPLAPSYARRWGISIGLCRWVMRHAGRFDIVHVHQTWGLAQVTALVAAIVWRRPVVVTPHESLTNYDVDREKTFVKSLLKRWYLRAAGRIEVSSPLEQDDSVPPRHLGKSQVVPHPLEESETSIVSVSPRTAGEPLTVGFLGRLHPKKNVDLLIQAVAQGAVSTRLRVAGDGPEEFKRSLVRCAADHGVVDRVEWLGFVPADDRSAFLGSIDVLVLASEYECFGIVIAEAMAQSVPVIVSPRTGLAPMVVEYGCGIVVEPTVSDVAAALALLATDVELAARLGSQGPIAVREELSLSAYGAVARLGYEGLLSARGRDRPAQWARATTR